MSSKLDELRKQHERALAKAKEIEDQLQEEQIKELERENAPIRYDSETGIFIVKVPSSESNSGYTEIELTLSDDHLDNLYQEIAKEKISGLLTALKGQINQGDGWKRSPPIPGWGDSFPEVGKILLKDNSPFSKAINELLS